MTTPPNTPHQRSASHDEPDRTLFHRKHFVTTFWVLIAALVTFVGTTAWQGRQGPQKVYITNPDTTVRTVVVGDTATREYMETMIRELRELRRSSPVSNRVGAASASGTDARPLPGSAFAFPPKVKGYLQSDLAMVATGTCPRGEFPPGSEFQFSVRVPNQDLVLKLSPLFVSIDQRDRNYVTQMLERRYQRQAATDVVLNAPATPGKYDLVYGYYLLSELNATYPPFYRKTCNLTVR